MSAYTEEIALAKELVEFFKQGKAIITETGATPLLKEGAKSFVSLLKSIFNKTSQKIALDKVEEASQDDDNAFTELAILLKGAIQDKDVKEEELTKLKAELDQFKKLLKKERPEQYNNAQANIINSKNVVQGNTFGDIVGGFRVGDDINKK